jgi:hypothetical protein
MSLLLIDWLGTPVEMWDADVQSAAITPGGAADRHCIEEHKPGTPGSASPPLTSNSHGTYANGFSKIG